MAGLLEALGLVQARQELAEQLLELLLAFRRQSGPGRQGRRRR
jgi:hypothetical protein